jgi:hypothetical protein
VHTTLTGENGFSVKTYSFFAVRQILRILALVRALLVCVIAVWSSKRNWRWLPDNLDMLYGKNGTI